MTPFKVIAFKVRMSVAARVKPIVRKFGVSFYLLGQMFLDFILRYGDPRHNLSNEIEELMSAFEHLDGWKDAFNLADPTTTPEIAEATYFLGDAQHKGLRAIHVEKPFFGRWTQTANVQYIIERMFLNLTPELYKKLRSWAVELGTTSILLLLIKLTVEHSKEADVAEIRKGFEDASRSEFGRKPNEDIYRRKIHRSPDDMPGLFDNHIINNNNSNEE